MRILGASRATIIEAASTLMNGNLVAFPTETVYGLGADAENLGAIKKLYSVKGRPANHPVIIHIGELSELQYWIRELPEYVEKLSKQFWPGPMTLLLKRSSIVLDELTGGQDMVGIRIPAHPVALELLKEIHALGGHGLAAPSANRFGKVSATDSVAVKMELGQFLNEKDLIIDGGSSEVGIESTIIDCTMRQVRIVRLGKITEEIIESLGIEIDQNSKKGIRVSGSLLSHYSPNTKLLVDQQPVSGQGLIALKSFPTPLGVLRIAEPTDVEEYARVLYASFRKADYLQLDETCVFPPEGTGLAAAIRDRIYKAAFR